MDQQKQAEYITVVKRLKDTVGVQATKATTVTYNNTINNNNNNNNNITITRNNDNLIEVRLNYFFMYIFGS